MVRTYRFSIKTKGNNDMHDITPFVEEAVVNSTMLYGIAVVFVVGSTAAITTIEYEPGLQKDMETAMERIAPKDAFYAHEARWGDDNGHSHIRASLVGPSIVVPFTEKKLALGTWQQIVLIDFDTHPRSRTILVQTMGE